MILGVPCGKASPVPHACEEISLAHEGNGHASSSDRSDHFGMPMVSPRKWSEKYWKVSFYRCSIHQKSGIAWWTIYHDYHVLYWLLIYCVYCMIFFYHSWSYHTQSTQIMRTRFGVTPSDPTWPQVRLMVVGLGASHASKSVVHGQVWKR